MDIYLHNGLTDHKEKFIPIQPGQVTMYVCGPTVYDYVHIGNLRPVVVFDVLKKLFLALGYQVKHVSNFTDIDDRIIDRAQREHTTEAIISEKFIEAYKQDVTSIQALMPDLTPTVTHHLPAMIIFIQDLIKKGFAYKTPQGDVYFRVSKVHDYGRLSHIDIDHLHVGARVEENPHKENPLDFVLWKKTTQGITFSAPFGDGRPGWHTECVVMIQESFQKPLIDIHGGGFDLKFPHHENEIAQAQAAYQTTLANYWLHNGFINLNQEKMSKSKGNIMFAKDFMQRYSPLVLRYLLLATHYRMPVNMNDLIIENAIQELRKITLTLQQLASVLQLLDQDISHPKTTQPEEFLHALADDLNTANALTVLHKELKEVSIFLRKEPKDLPRLLNHFFTIQTMVDILGLAIPFTILTADDRRLYQEYLFAKAKQDFGRSDAIRKILNERHIFF